MTNKAVASADERGVVEVFDRARYKTENPDADLATCGNCERTWDDAVVTSWTPVPSGRCPFEYDHEGEHEREIPNREPLERDVELIARILHREHQRLYGDPFSRPAWSAESDIYRESFRERARLHLAELAKEPDE